ncbi:ribonuclease H-like domain-containing protein [Tanacetum coccineum]
MVKVEARDQQVVSDLDVKFLNKMIKNQNQFILDLFLSDKIEALENVEEVAAGNIDPTSLRRKAGHEEWRDKAEEICNHGYILLESTLSDAVGYEMAMLTIRARRFIKRTDRKLDVNGQRVGLDRSKVECYNFHKNGHFVRECRLPRNRENRERENGRRSVTVETPTKMPCLAQDGIRGY